MGAPDQVEVPAKRVLGRGGLRIEVDVQGGERGTVVHLFGELDMEATELLAQELDGLIGATAASVTVDLSRLEFIDSSGLQCLLQATQHSHENGDKLRFQGSSSQVDGVLRLTQVGNRLPFVD